MAQATLSGSIVIAGVGINVSVTKTKTGQITVDRELPKGYTGVVTSGGGTAGGTLTVSGADGLFTDADFIDVYLTTGTGDISYEGNISDVTGDVITVAGFTNNLPANTTAIIVSKRIVINVDIDGDHMEAIAAGCGARAHLVFEDSGDAELLVQEITTAALSWYWFNESGWTRPITGNAVDEIHASTANTGADQTLVIGILFDTDT